MQPCSREMQSMNSILEQQHHNSQIRNGAYDHAPPSHDDFLEQMLSTLPSSCSWPNVESAIKSSSPPCWDPQPPAPPPDETDSSDQHIKMMMQQQQQQMMMLSHNDVFEGSSTSSFKSLVGDSAVNALYNGLGGASLHGGSGQVPTQQTPQFHPPQTFGAVSGVGVPTKSANQGQASVSTNGAPTQAKPRTRARRGQATDPHSIAERLRRERIAERMKALQELVPNANKTDKASMLDEIIEYVKFLQLQVKVLSMSRLGGAAGVGPRVADHISAEGGGDGLQAGVGNGGSMSRNGRQTNDSLTVTEHQVAKLMEEDMGSAMQYLQGKGLCLMPISLATAISTATCHSRSSLANNVNLNNNNNINNNALTRGEGPPSPNMSALTVQSATRGGGGGDVKDSEA